MKRFVAILLSLPMLLFAAMPVLASVDANEYYSDASIAFNTKGNAVFSCTTTFQFNELKITDCKLEVKGLLFWSDAGELPAPSYVAKNRFNYDYQVDYSSYLTSGKTYRIVGTFNADGHEITKTSGSAKYQ